MKKSFLLLVFALLLQGLYAQAHLDQYRDKVWLMGFDSWAHAQFSFLGGTRLTFGPDSMAMEYDSVGCDLGGTNASICDEQGNLVAYTNGAHLCDSAGQFMNATGLSGWSLGNPGYRPGDRTLQGALMLPKPGSPDEYVLLHSQSRVVGYYLGYPHLGLDGLWMTTFSVGAGGLQIGQLNEVVSTEWFVYGKMTACRHANGRDWWVLLGGWFDDLYYRFLLDPSGLRLVGTGTLPSLLESSSGQAVFTPDGSRYINYGSMRFSDPFRIRIYDFDRCTGLLNNERDLIIPNDTASIGGCAVSPNSRYLYTNSYRRIYQFDLWAADIAASRQTVAFWDGYVDTLTVPGIAYVTQFRIQQLTPSGEIYLNTADKNGSYLHVINHPDSAGLACGVVQRQLNLLTLYQAGLPNFPHFRLGALDGSSCDTLGLDAWTGTGYVPPPSPLADAPAPQLSVYPNPATHAATVLLGSPLPEPGRMEVHDMQGRLMGAWPLQTATLGYGIDVHTWPAGVYVASVWCGGRFVGSVRVVKE